MESKAFRYFLFPHTILSERDFRHLALLIPNLSLLEAARAASIPNWAQERFSACPVLREPERIAEVNRHLRGYQDFAQLHGENSALASMSCDWISKEFRESRFQIQGDLRGKSPRSDENREALRLEAAVFLEMARDLDERGIELENGFNRVESLEGEFRKILGINGEEELDEAAETLSPPLAAEKANLTFMLPKRMAYWYRLFSELQLEEVPAFIAVSRLVPEELLEPARAASERSGSAWPESLIPIASIPPLEALKSEDYLKLQAELHDSKVLERYWESLEKTLRAPGDASARAELEARAEDLSRSIEAFCAEAGVLGEDRVQMTLTWVSGCSQAQLWKCLDRGGHEACASEGCLKSAPALLLSLS